jgi:hypothetical protein
MSLTNIVIADLADLRLAVTISLCVEMGFQDQRRAPCAKDKD